MTIEEWRPVVGYEGLYEVSDLGRIKSINNRLRKLGPKILKGSINHGYRHVALCKNGTVKTPGVHSLVLQAFVGPRDATKAEGCRHLDGNPLNNVLSNLRWGNHAENYLDSLHHGTAGKCLLTKDDVLRIREAKLFGATTNDLVQVWGVSKSAINRIISRNTWHYI